MLGAREELALKHERGVGEEELRLAKAEEKENGEVPRWSTRRLMGHIHGREVASPSLGLRPALPENMTACDSTKRWKKLSEYVEKVMLGTEKKKKLEARNSVGQHLC